MSELRSGAQTALRGFNADEAATPRLPLIWPIIIACAILYGSLLPFRFDGTSLRSMSLPALLSSSLRFTTLDDVVTNLLVYMPLGLAVVLCARRLRGAALLGRVILATLCGAGLSVLAETLQCALPVRVSSLADVALNTIGAGIGAVVGAVLTLAIARSWFAWRTAWKTAPFVVITTALSIGLLLFGLMPFDFVTDTASLHESFRRARWDLIGLRPIGSDTPALAPFAAQYAAAAWFAMLGYLGTRAGRERRFSLAWAWTTAVKHGVTLACVIEVMQLFTQSHQFDMASMVLRSLAVAFGAWIAVTADGWNLKTKSGTRGLARVPVAVLIGLAMAQLVALILPRLDPAIMTWSQVELSSIGWLPFEALWHRPIGVVFAELCGSLVVFSAFSATIAALLAGLRIRRFWSGTLVTTTLAACSIEMLQLCTIGRHADLTGPTLAVFAVFFVSRFPNLIQPPQAAETAPRPAPLPHTADVTVQA